MVLSGPAKQFRTEAMQFNELKEALQPTIAVDMDQLYTEFVQERGSGDLVAFVTELYRKQHITQETLHRLVNEGALNAEWVGTLAGQNEESETSSQDAAEGTAETGSEETSASDSGGNEEVKTRKEAQVCGPLVGRQGLVRDRGTFAVPVRVPVHAVPRALRTNSGRQCLGGAKTKHLKRHPVTPRIFLSESTAFMGSWVRVQWAVYSAQKTWI